MTPDDFQQAWQSPASHARVTVHADVLLAEVQRGQQNFSHMIWLRDVREIGIALLLIPVWLIMGYFLSLPWTWYLMLPSLVGVIAFMLLDRRRHPQDPSPPGAPLVHSVEVSLTQVEHQIWLLRNVVWWYLLPFAVPMLLFFAQAGWDSAVKTNQWLFGLFFFWMLSAFVLGLYGFVYWINQRAVRTVLEPRRQGLRALLTSLQSESAGSVAAGDPLAVELPRELFNPPTLRSFDGSQSLNVPSRRVFVAALCFALILLAIGLGVALLGYFLDQRGAGRADPPSAAASERGSGRETARVAR